MVDDAGDASESTPALSSAAKTCSLLRWIAAVATHPGTSQDRKCVSMVDHRQRQAVHGADCCCFVMCARHEPAMAE